MARVIKKFKNLPLSLALRHQSMESAKSLGIHGESVGSCPMVSDDMTFGKGKLLLGHDLQYALNTIMRFYELDYRNGCNAINVFQLQYVEPSTKQVQTTFLSLAWMTWTYHSL